MQRTDMQLLADRLNGLAETFDKRPVSVKALEVWFDTLKEFPTERVMDLLNHWAKGHGKFPTPAEVWKTVNDRMIEAREEETRRLASQFVEETRQGFRTARGREIIQRMREFAKGDVHPKAWAYEIIRAYRDGDFLRYTDPMSGKRLPKGEAEVSEDQFEFAIAALKVSREVALGAGWNAYQEAA